MGNTQPNKRKSKKKTEKAEKKKDSASFAIRLPKSDVITTLSHQKKALDHSASIEKIHPHFILRRASYIYIYLYESGIKGLGLFYRIPTDVLVLEILPQLNIRDILALSATSR